MSMLLWFLVVCILAFIWTSAADIERFVQDPLLVFQVHLKKDKLLVLDSQYTDVVMSFIKKVYSIQVTKKTDTSHVYVDDAFTLYTSNNDTTHLVTVLPEQLVLVIAKKKNQYTKEMLSSAVLRKTSFFFANNKAKQLFQVLLTSNNTKLFWNDIVISRQNTIEQAFAQGDYIVILDTLKTITETMNFSDIDFIDYSDMDVHKYKVYIPFALMKNVDMKVHLSAYNDKFPVHQLMHIDLVMATDKNIDKYSDEVKQILDITNTQSLNSFYMSFFPFVSSAKEYNRSYNKYVSERDRMTILEQFMDIHDSVIEVTSPILSAFYKHDTGELLVESQSIHGIPMVLGMKIKTMNQHYPEHNGNFTVVQITNQGTTFKKDLTLKRYFEEGGQFDTRYKCFENETIKAEPKCKQLQYTWDRPCESNADCPFFQSNKTYNNYRGGCHDGYCEMPIGVLRKGFRQFDQNSKPWCHGCPINDPACCDKQTSPDYAFPLDIYSREIGKKV